MGARPRLRSTVADRAVRWILVGSPVLVLATGLALAWSCARGLSEALARAEAELVGELVRAVAESSSPTSGKGEPTVGARSARSPLSGLVADDRVRAAALLAPDGTVIGVPDWAVGLGPPAHPPPRSALASSASARVVVLPEETRAGSPRTAEILVPILREGVSRELLHLVVALRHEPARLWADLVGSALCLALLCASLSALPGWWLARRLALVSADAAENRRLALHDALTGLPNRLLFADRLALALARVRREGSRGALLVLDLDGFKAVNDRFGHAGGDELLRAVARRLLASVRASDTVARLGGDEFALVVAPLASEKALATLLARIRGAFARAFPIEGRLLRVRASIGIARFPEQGVEPERLLRLADAALYRDKREARRGREGPSES
ncbi:MAG: GGDEF domain-containing protein [Geminicoccaceae bacterium]|nr:GGDEF domain-containing protein [Geminicoccaceae bacterium]